MSRGFASKVEEYEHFLNETLRGDLKKLITLREKTFEEIAKYYQLQRIIEDLMKHHEENQPIHTQIDLGCNFYAHAVANNNSKIFVCVGYGFFVEFTFDEALKFISKKTAFLNNKVEKVSKDMAEVKARIRMVNEGLREMQNMQWPSV